MSVSINCPALGPLCVSWTVSRLTNLQPGPVHLWSDELGQLDPDFPLLLHRVEDGVEHDHGAFVLQQRYVHHALQGREGAIFCPVFHDVERLAAPQQLDVGQLLRGASVEELEDGGSLLGGVAGIQGSGVGPAAGLRCGRESRVQGLETRHGDPAPPAAGAL